MTTVQPPLVLWQIVVIAVGGALVLGLVVGLLIWQCRRRRRRVSEDDDFPPFHRLAVRRGRVVPASWNLSLGASIFTSKFDTSSFVSLDDQLTGGRRSRRSKARPQMSRQSSHMSTQSQMTEAKTPSTSQQQLRYSRAHNREMIQTVDDEFLTRDPRPTFKRVSTASTSFTFPSIVNGREFGQDDTHSISDSISEGPGMTGIAQAVQIVDLQKPASALSKSQRHRNSQQISSKPSIPRSKYTALGSENQSSPLSRPMTAASSSDTLPTVVEDPPPPPPPLPTEPEDAEARSNPTLRRKASGRLQLTPLAVPAPVLASTPAPLSPFTSSHSWISAQRPRTAPTPQQPTSKRNSRSRLSLNPFSNANSSSNVPIPVSKYASPANVASPLSQTFNPPEVPHSLLQQEYPTKQSTFSSSSSRRTSLYPNESSRPTTAKSVDNASIPQRSQDLSRTPSKKGNVLRKKSLKRMPQT